MKYFLLVLFFSPSFLLAQTFSYQTFFNQSPYSNHLDLELIHIITQAQSTIDCHFYDIDRTNIVHAFQYVATNRNVKIRILTDSDNYNSFCTNLNATSNIEVYNDQKTNIYQNGSRESHNKFAIFDFGDSSSPVRNFVWTGSYNITDTGTENNANNVVLINETTTNLSAQYEKEFREMWGVDDSPSYEFQFNTDGTSKFGSAKADNTRHILSLGTATNNVELYFAPSDNVESNIISALQSADYNIYFCIFTFTSDGIREIMTNKFFQGVDVRGVFDAFQKNGSGGEYGVFTNIGVPVVPDALSGLLHHKYMIIDYGHPESDPIVITGSYNWTASANTVNDENTLIIHDTVMATQFFEEFKSRYEEAGGIFTNLGPQPPNQPQWVSATATSEQSIFLLWHDLPNETSYTLFRNTVNDTNSAIQISGLNANITNYSDTGLLRETQYYYWLKGYNGFGASKFSELIYSTTLSESVLNQKLEVSFVNNYIDPTSSEQKIMIQCPDNEDVSFSVYSDSGQLIDKFSSNYQSSLDWRINQNKIIIKTGLYFFKVVSKNKEFVEKVLVIR